MKRIFLLVAISGLLLANTALAQSTEGGLPWSMTERQVVAAENAAVPLVVVPAPDYEQARKEDKVATTGPYRAGLLVDADIDLKNAGTFIYLPDGRKIWTVKITVAGAKALNLYYDPFYLPKGVRLFLKNENGKQVVGAITSAYNPGTKIFATTATQGNTVTVELDIAPGVAVDDIQFHIFQISAMYRGGEIAALEGAYGEDANIVINTINPWPYNQDNSDPCHVNAICEPEGSTYANIKQTAVHISMPFGGGVGFCSGNLINNTSHDCAPLFLTASHCNPSNGTTDAAFSTWIFYFNYEYPECDGNTPGTAPMDDYVTGAKFLARSYYEEGNPQIVGDFLLLKLNNPNNIIGNQFNAYLAGWDRSNAAPSGTKFIDFHHPSGDPKKVTVFAAMAGNGNFNGGANGSHWKASDLEKGGIEGGSSGSGIFAESTGRLYGDLSGGPTLASACDDPPWILNYSVYSKLYLNWEYTSGGDGTAATRLKDWLDPTGTDALYTNTIKMAGDGDTCENTNGPAVGVKEVEALNEGLTLFPNPSSGMVSLRVNLSMETDLTINVFNMLGVQVGVFKAGNIAKGVLKMDMTGYADGIYMLQIKTNDASISRKVVLTR